jgi:hypothetical protein
MDTKWIQKNGYKFYCNNCLHGSNNKKDFIRHLSTTKHLNGYKMDTNGYKKIPLAYSVTEHDGKNNLLPLSSKGINGINPQKSPRHYQCNCGKQYVYKQGLYKHTKTCKWCFMGLNNTDDTSSEITISNTVKNDSDVDSFKDLVVLLLKENKEIQKKFVDLIPNIQGNNNNNIITTTTTNNQFNINMFLNDHCKHAMNLTDFIDSLPITNETYNHTIENGLTETITHMITDGLNNMDILKRPIHCTDPARKTMYVKDNNVWEKDNELNKVLNSIKTIALKQRTMINKWQNANIGWKEDDTLQTKLTNLVFNSMTDIENDKKECNKIIRAISKNTYLNNTIKDVYK